MVSEANIVLPQLTTSEWKILWSVLGSAVVALAYGFYMVWKVLACDPGTPAMQRVAKAIEDGAMAYLRRQIKVMWMFILVIFVGLYMMYSNLYQGNTQLALGVALAFLAGVFASYGAGYVGMWLAVKGNVRPAAAAMVSFPKAMEVAFNAGTVSGMFTVGFGLLGATLIFLVFREQAMRVLVGFGFGGSLAALFLRVGGGIYTKAADIGADLVGKIEAGIPEDDPRNPAVIADNVGDNVGDCAGMAADLFETYAVTAVATMLLGSLLYKVGGKPDLVFVFYPLMLGAVSIVASIIGTFFVRMGKGTWIMGALYRGLIVSAIVALAGFLLITVLLNNGGYLSGFDHPVFNLFWCAVIGIVITVLIVAVTEFFTGAQFWPVRTIARASQTGHATNIIPGLAIGMEGTAIPVLIIAIGILASAALGGLYGIGIAATALLSMTGIVVAIDSYGPITDNAGGIAEMADLPESVRQVTDPLDAVGNTTKAVTKGYAIGSAGLAALVLFASYTDILNNTLTAHHLPLVTFDLTAPPVIAGLLLGGIMPFLFGSLAMLAVGRAAGQGVLEGRRRFRETPGIM